MSKKIRVGIIGLGFGAEFIPIYQQHPNAEMVAICQRDPVKLKAIGDAFGVPRRYTDWRELIQDSELDAVHINAPIPDRKTAKTETDNQQTTHKRAPQVIRCKHPEGTRLPRVPSGWGSAPLKGAGG